MDDKTYELQDLREGTSFEVVGCEDYYRKLVLIGATYGAALIKGEYTTHDIKLDDDGNEEPREWSSFGAGSYFSPRTPVRVKS